MIQKDQVVSLAYTLKDDAGKIIDEAEKATPFAYLHGHGQIVPGLEKALEGKTSGASLAVVLEPADAYGDVDPGLRIKLERTQFPEGVELTPGMHFQAQLEQDAAPVVFRIDSIQDQHVLVDGNHPLAGVRLHFDVEVMEVRSATAEELAHGHAHGAGGHHHHD